VVGLFVFIIFFLWQKAVSASRPIVKESVLSGQGFDNFCRMRWRNRSKGWLSFYTTETDPQWIIPLILVKQLRMDFDL
jgi:hypothetical protein